MKESMYLFLSRARWKRILSLAWTNIMSFNLFCFAVVGSGKSEEKNNAISRAWFVRARVCLD